MSDGAASAAVAGNDSTEPGTPASEARRPSSGRRDSTLIGGDLPEKATGRSFHRTESGSMSPSWHSSADAARFAKARGPAVSTRLARDPAVETAAGEPVGRCTWSPLLPGCPRWRRGAAEPDDDERRRPRRWWRGALGLREEDRVRRRSLRRRERRAERDTERRRRPPAGGRGWKGASSAAAARFGRLEPSVRPRSCAASPLAAAEPELRAAMTGTSAVDIGGSAPADEEGSPPKEPAGAAELVSAGKAATGAEVLTLGAVPGSSNVSRRIN